MASRDSLPKTLRHPSRRGWPFEGATCRTGTLSAQEAVLAPPSPAPGSVYFLPLQICILRVFTCGVTPLTASRSVREGPAFCAVPGELGGPGVFCAAVTWESSLGPQPRHSPLALPRHSDQRGCVSVFVSADFITEVASSVVSSIPSVNQQLRTARRA